MLALLGLEGVGSGIVVGGQQWICWGLGVNNYLPKVAEDAGLGQQCIRMEHGREEEHEKVRVKGRLWQWWPATIRGLAMMAGRCCWDFSIMSLGSSHSEEEEGWDRLFFLGGGLWKKNQNKPFPFLFKLKGSHHSSFHFFFLFRFSSYFASNFLFSHIKLNLILFLITIAIWSIFYPTVG